MTLDMTLIATTIHAWRCREKEEQVCPAEARSVGGKKRRKLSGNPRSPALAGTADPPKGADPADAGQVVVDETRLGFAPAGNAGRTCQLSH